AAVSVLTFLFIETNSAWGGNIPSTLAGEFAYSLSLSLSLVFLGRMYRHLPAGGKIVSNAVLLALVGLSHGYTLLFCVLGSGFFLLTSSSLINRLAYVLKVNLLAFCFMGFWIVPLLVYTPYSTPFSLVWKIESWREVLPVIIWPFIALGLVGIIREFSSRGEAGQNKGRVFFFLYLIVTAVILYFTAYRLGVVDVRFLPLVQLTLVLLGAGTLGRFVSRLRAKEIAALALALAVLVWTAHNETYTARWAGWNFSGFNHKPLFAAFEQVCRHLKGGPADPRVVYEHAEITDGVGTVRAFELLPFFSGRSTLEGLYIQAGLTSPFVFYLQSEVSPAISAPLREYNYARFDLARSLAHLGLFGVKHYVTATYPAQAAAQKTPGFELEKSFPPFAVFRVSTGTGRYAAQPRFRPVLAISSDPRRDSFDWFRRGDQEVPLVLASRATEREKALFAAVIRTSEVNQKLDQLPREVLPAPSGIKETIRPEEIIIEGATPGRPLWIRMSYHPGWRVEGARRVWRAAPSFMLVFPERERVRLYFARGLPDYLGLALTLLAGLYALTTLVRRRNPAEGRNPARRAGGLLKPIIAGVGPRAKFVLAAAVALSAAGALVLMIVMRPQDPVGYYQRGVSLLKAGRYEAARKVFQTSVERYPLSPVVDQTFNQWALSYYQQGRLAEALQTWERFKREYPESRAIPEVLFRMGLAEHDLKRNMQSDLIWSDLVVEFPDSDWAKKAAEGLSGRHGLGWDRLFASAMDVYQDGRFDQAQRLFAAVRERSPDKTTAQTAAFYAATALVMCERWPEAAGALARLLERDCPEILRARAVMYSGLVKLRLGDLQGALVWFLSPEVRSAPSELAVLAGAMAFWAGAGGLF
ncbi:MAG: 6-pyruvoyl-tetrahydropterin synthase-related protein, partial [Pseudomonadota bacterium]